MAFERAVGLLDLVGVQAVGEHRVRQPHRGGVGLPARGPQGRSVQYSLRYCWVTAWASVNAPVWNQVRVSTGGDQDCWSQLANVAVVEVGVGAELLGVALLDQAESAELTLVAVEVPVMVGVAGDEPVPADPVDRLGALHHLDGKRQPGDPRRARGLVGDVEAGGRRVLTRVSAPRLLRAPVIRCGFWPPIRSTYSSGAAVSPGSGEDQTRQAVPVPSRSMAWTVLSRSAAGKTAMRVGADQEFPDWLNQVVTPSSPT